MRAEHGHELVAAPEDDGRPEDGPVELARAHRLLGLPLRPVIARAARRAACPARSSATIALDAGRPGELRACSAVAWTCRRSKVTPRARCSRMMPTRCTRRAQPSTLGGEPVGLEHVAGHAVDGLEALEVPLRARPDEAADEKTLRKKCADDRLADEAGAAGHEHRAAPRANRSTGQAPRFSRGGPREPPRIIGPCGFAAAVLLAVLPAADCWSRPRRRSGPRRLDLVSDRGRGGAGLGGARRDPGRGAPRRPGRSGPPPQGPGLARHRARPRADDRGHHLRHRVAHQGDRHHARRPAARGDGQDRSGRAARPLSQGIRIPPLFQDVTVRRVLTHSAGMHDLPSREAMAKGFPEAGGCSRRACRARGAARLRVPLQRHRLHPARRAGPARERRAARPLRAEALLRRRSACATPRSIRPRRGASASRPPRR